MILSCTCVTLRLILLQATFRMNGTNADDKVDEGCALEGTTVLATQVGGHRFDQKAGRKLGNVLVLVEKPLKCVLMLKSVFSTDEC